jgi:serine O-acetyltransferase
MPAQVMVQKMPSFRPLNDDGESRADLRREPPLDALVDTLVASYADDACGQHLNRRYLPSREEIVAILQLCFQVFYPGYHGRQDLTDQNIRFHVGMLLSELRERLGRQIEICIAYGDECEQSRNAAESRAIPPCSKLCSELTGRFLEVLPELRGRLIEDARAAYDGDPAARSYDEIVLAYPGFLALTVHRVAHELYVLGVPLMPRMMAEWAHAQTGADIHPGAEIGPRFFLDHATGAVVGETATIGADVKLYQGVTLGALSFPRDARGRVIRGTKRHPTVEDKVTIYANATVLGGATVVGEGSVIGGSVFVTRSVPSRSQVALKPPELATRKVAGSDSASTIDSDSWVLDFTI